MNIELMQANPFVEFQKIGRLDRECFVSEKLDGTNACVLVTDDGHLLAGSRTRWITPEDDNFGFARWAKEHEAELLTLGPGRHYGEWWGAGIQRRYGQTVKRFSLFNTARWTEATPPPACCSVVPLLHVGRFDTEAIRAAADRLIVSGSVAAPGFMKPEGIVVYHAHANQYFKFTLDGDGHKGSNPRFVGKGATP